MTFLNGPRLTETKLRPIQGEDHLGVKNVAITMSDTLQTGITSITPRARYWSFYAWVLHDFIQTQSNKTIENFRKYLKFQEWYFIVANIAEAKDKNLNIKGLVGITKGEEIWERTKGNISYVDDYLKNASGGYNIYGNVMKIVGVSREGDSDRGVQIDKLTPIGKELAEHFQKNVEHTVFFKDWRQSQGPIPRDVLLEYGQKASLSKLYPHGEDLLTLKSLFMPEETEDISKQMRYDSLSYYQHIVRTNSNKQLNFNAWRFIMYDQYTPTSDHYQNLPVKLTTVAKGWEVYHGRQLFTYSLESIWSYILDLLLVQSLSIDEIIDTILEDLKSNELSTNQSVTSLVESLPMDRESREEYIIYMRQESLNIVNRVWNPLLVLLDVYVRFRGRNDLIIGNVNFKELGRSEHISLTYWEKTVDTYLEQPISELLIKVIRSLIIQQHKQVALSKIISTKNDTYHFIESDGRLHFLENDRPSMNVFRVEQAMTILEDLGILLRLDGKWISAEGGGVS